MHSRLLLLLPLICGVFFLGQAAQCAVVFYNPTERIRLSNLDAATQDYNIDLNGDGSFDLQHDSVGRATFLRTWGTTRIIGLRQPYVNVTWYDSLPYALSAGTNIGLDSPTLFPEDGVNSGWWSQPLGSPGAGALHVAYDSGTSGFFYRSRGYIGIEFQIAGQNHYGWIELSNPTIWQSEIHGWAYESEPGVPIIAGAIPELSASSFAILSLCSLLFRRRRSKDHNRTSESRQVTPTGRCV